MAQKCLVVKCNHLYIIIIPLQNGETAVMLASENGHTESLKLLLNKRPDCNIKNKVIERRNGICKTCMCTIIFIMPPQWGQTALMMACENGRTDCVKLLIKAGVKLNIGDEVYTLFILKSVYTPQ